MESIGRHLKKGTILADKYQIEEGIGDGGFSLTYRATDLDLQRTIAIKEFFPRNVVARGEDGKSVIPNSNQEDEEFFHSEKEKFIEEGRRLAKFYTLPGVVSVLNFFVENGTAYLVMDYIHGKTLAQQLKTAGKPMSVEETLNLLRPVILALQKIHETGMVHRDISPDNIMISQDNGKVFLIDFGTARIANASNEQGLSVYYRADGYTPVEQLRQNGQQGPWTDVYAFCATIYRCITGKNPEDVHARLEEDNLERPSSLDVTISQEVEEALMEGLAIYSKDRIPDMKKLFHRLYDPGVTMPGPKAEEASVTMPVTMPAKPEPKPLPQAEKSLPKEETPLPQNGKVEIKSASRKKKNNVGIYAALIAILLIIFATVGITADTSKYGVHKTTTNDGTYKMLYYNLYDGEYAGGRVCYYFTDSDYKNLDSVIFFTSDNEKAKQIQIMENGHCWVDGCSEYDYTLQWKKRTTGIKLLESFLDTTVPYITIGDHLYSMRYQEEDGSCGNFYYDENGDLASKSQYFAEGNYTEYTYYYAGTEQISFYGKYVGKFNYDKDDGIYTRIIEARSWYEDGTEQMIRYYQDGYTYYQEFDENGKKTVDESGECVLVSE